jgi:choloylglycine hydrolase
MDDIQLVMVSARGFDATLHLAIEDASGDSAIIEFDHRQSRAPRPPVHPDDQ